MAPWDTSACCYVQCGVPKSRFQSRYSRLGTREAAADGPGTWILPPSLLGVLNGVLASWLLPGPALAVGAAWGEKQSTGHREPFLPLALSHGSSLWGFNPQVATKAGTGPGRSRSPGLYPVLHSGFRGLSPWAVSLCFPRHGSRQLDPTGKGSQEGPALWGSG